MTATTLVTGTKRGRSSALLRGSPEVITDALIATGKTFRWSKADHGYLVPLTVVDAVLVAIENAGHEVQWREGLW